MADAPDLGSGALRACGFKSHLPHSPKVWIDIANSPQALFFKPIVDELRKLSIEVLITVRDFGQNVEIATREFGNVCIVGKHDGRNILKKSFGLFKRAKQLVDFYRRYHFQVQLSLSHNSYHHILASKFLGIRTITFMDFEGQKANHVAFRLADKVVVPRCFKKKHLRMYGASDRKVEFYEGFKEEVYIWNFRDEEDYFKELGIPRNKPIAILRTPPETALYFKGNDTFWKVLNYLKQRTNVLVLWRTKEQYSRLKGNEGIFVFNKPIHGLRALFWADLTVGAGGTMNRESALLGTPTYSIFKGEKPGVDECLERKGWLRYIEEPEDIDVRFKENFQTRVKSDKVLRQIMDIILNHL